MSRHVLITFLYLSTTYFLISCEENNTEKKILGTWECIRGHYYGYGMDKEMILDDDENIFFGSVNKPRTFKFSNHGEFFTDLNRKNNRVFNYSISNDTILLPEFGNYTILKLTNDSLTLEHESQIIYFDPAADHPREFLTFYCKRVKD